MKNQRNYRGKDVYMLLASKTIANSLQKNLSELTVVRSNWTPEFVSTFINIIDDATEKYIGLDKKKALRLSTLNIDSIIKPAKRYLSFLKIQVQVDFKDKEENLSEILKSLTYPKNMKRINENDQEAIIELLYGFKKGMTDELKTKIVANGTSPDLIDTIIGYATQLNEANVIQESLKETSKEITQEALSTFKSIYEQTIGICKIASSYFIDDPVKKKQFSYAHVLNNMTNIRKKENQEEEQHN